MLLTTVSIHYSQSFDLHSKRRGKKHIEEKLESGFYKQEKSLFNHKSGSQTKALKQGAFYNSSVGETMEC